MSRKRVIIGITIALFCIAFVVTAYFVRIDRLDRFGNAKIHWTDCLMINDRMYNNDYSNTTVEYSSIDKKIGKVKFNVSKMVTNPSYRFRNGDATFLPVGTEIYSLKSESNAVAVKIDEKYYLYKLSFKNIT